MRQSARGESDSVIFGPSGTQLRLYCAAGKRRQNIANVLPIVISSYRPRKAIPARCDNFASEAPFARKC